MAKPKTTAGAKGAPAKPAKRPVGRFPNPLDPKGPRLFLEDVKALAKKNKEPVVVEAGGRKLLEVRPDGSLQRLVAVVRSEWRPVEQTDEEKASGAPVRLERVEKHRHPRAAIARIEGRELVFWEPKHHVALVRLMAKHKLPVRRGRAVVIPAEKLEQVTAALEADGWLVNPPEPEPVVEAPAPTEPEPAEEGLEAPPAPEPTGPLPE